MSTPEAKQEAAAAAPPEAAAAPVKEIVIELESPVMAYGDMAKKLTFRKPTGSDLMQFADSPINIDWMAGQVTPNAKVMGPMMALLANVPLSTVHALEAKDFQTCAWALVGFFAPGAQAMRY